LYVEEFRSWVFNIAAPFRQGEPPTFFRGV
jgi:hypothetical protein